MCKLNYFDTVCNTSFTEHLPTDGHNRWPKTCSRLCCL